MQIRRFLLTIVAIAGFYAANAMALLPEAGLWGGPGEDGRGLSIEIQDDNMFVTFYGYEPDGVRSAFYTSLGKYNLATGVMTGYFAAARNGQCYGCAPRSPILTDLGDVRFEFDTRTTGRMFLPGVAFPIEIARSVLRGSAIDSRDELYGTWTETHGAQGFYFGDTLWFRSPYASTTLANAFSGERVDSGRALLGSAGAPGSDDSIFVLIDSSPSYYTAIAFTPTLDHWIGRSWTYLKTDTISGNGLSSFGNRLLGRVYSEQSNASAVATVAGSWKDANVASEQAAAASAKATADAAVGGNPESVMIDETSIKFSTLQKTFSDLAAQMRLSK